MGHILAQNIAPILHHGITLRKLDLQALLDHAHPHPRQRQATLNQSRAHLTALSMVLIHVHLEVTMDRNHLINHDCSTNSTCFLLLLH